MGRDRLLDPAPVIQPPGKSLFHHAATVSALMILPILGLFVQFLVPSFLQTGDGDVHASTFFLGGASFLILLVTVVLGIVSGIVALCGITKYGPQGILVKAMVGILVPTSIVLVSLFSIMQTDDEMVKLQAEPEAQKTNDSTSH